MGILLMLLGLGCTIASLVVSIVSIVTRDPMSIGVVLMVVGLLLVRAGRIVNRNSRK